MRISVVILTYNRNEMLKKCLDSVLLKQTRVPDEIVVVNSGQEDVEGLLKEYQREGCALRTVRAANKSLADNRNTGVKESSHELVAFTDDDCRVCPRWIQGFMDVFENGDGKIGSVGGRNYEENADSMARSISEISFLSEDYYNKKHPSSCYYFSTINVCYRKKALEEVGYFEGTYRRSYEDVITGMKVLSAGYKNVYKPGITVRHFGRGDVISVLRRFFEYGRDMRAGANMFGEDREGYVFKAKRSVFYIFFSTVTGPLLDSVRLKSGRAPLVTFISSLLMKISVNAGMITEMVVSSETQ